MPKSASELVRTITNKLLDDPIKFLNENPIKIAGSSTDGAITCYFNQEDNESRFEFNFSNHWYPLGIMVQNVRMIGMREPIDLTKLQAYKVRDQTEILVTGQLSGCSFVALKSNGNLLVTHVQPGGNRGDSKKLCSDLKSIGRFDGCDNDKLTVFGRGDNNSDDYMDDEYGYVIGIRKAGEWQIYCQRTKGLGHKVQVVSVKKLLK